MLRKLLLVVIMFVIAGGITAVVVLHKTAGRVATAKPTPATQPTTQPTTRKSSKPKYLSYMDLLRKDNSAVAATQPLDNALELPDAAHLVIHEPVYLDPSGNLWITSADGSPTAEALPRAADDEEHVIQDRPVFVHWILTDGNWDADVVVRGKDGFDIVSKKDRRRLCGDRPFKWESAFSVEGRIVVTTDVGVDVLEAEPKVVEHYHPLPAATAACNPPQVILDGREILAWSPWEAGKSGSNGVSKFADGRWSDLPALDWPARPVQLSPLLDGSVLRMAAGTPATQPTDTADAFADQMHLSIAGVESAQFDDARINDLVNKLSDEDGDVRRAAFDELSRYGPAIAPKLEAVMNDQVPEARLRIGQILRSKISASLAGMTPVDGRLDVARRFLDGSVLFYAPSGVEIPTEQGEPDVVNPAWLFMRSDGHIEHPLAPAIVRDQKPEGCTLRAVRDEWVIIDEAGPRRLVGSQFEPLLNESERRFSELVGISARRRWVFHDPAGDTLLIDPLVADPTPKLPAWVIPVDKGAAGWDAADFPAVSHTDQPGHWELNESGWKLLGEDDKFITKLGAATDPATNPASGPPLLTAVDGARYFDGRDSLVVHKPDGSTITWPLPAAAVGSVDPFLVRTKDGLLFLYNQRGRLLRIRPTPDEKEPFKLEATFTKDIPNADHPQRMWLDPAGRIDLVTDGNVLTITFPEGHIPKDIARMMLTPANQ